MPAGSATGWGRGSSCSASRIATTARIRKKAVGRKRSAPMDVEETLFRYIRHPHKFSTYASTPKTCDLCEEVRAGYEGPFYGDRDIDFVCETCLVTGKLRKAGLFTNQGDVAAVRKQLTKLYLQYSDKQREALCTERTAELER